MKTLQVKSGSSTEYCIKCMTRLQNYRVFSGRLCVRERERERERERDRERERERERGSVGLVGLSKHAGWATVGVWLEDGKMILHSETEGS